MKNFGIVIGIASLKGANFRFGICSGRCDKKGQAPLCASSKTTASAPGSSIAGTIPTGNITLIA